MGMVKDKGTHLSRPKLRLRSEPQSGPDAWRERLPELRRVELTSRVRRHAGLLLRVRAAVQSVLRFWKAKWKFRCCLLWGCGKKSISILVSTTKSVVTKQCKMPDCYEIR